MQKNKNNKKIKLTEKDKDKDKIRDVLIEEQSKIIQEVQQDINMESKD